jgi:hypothetical protein
MRRDPLAGWVPHIGKLLRQVVRRKEIDARLGELVPHNEGKHLAVLLNFLDRLYHQKLLKIA